MKEFDLIPDSYRIYLWNIKMTKLSVVTLISIIIILLFTYNAIVHATQEAETKIEQLNLIEDGKKQFKVKYEELLEEKNNLENKWKLLNGLRSTPPPEDIFSTIDDALVGLEVWFTNLNYNRTEQLSEQQSLVNTGYFIIINAGENESLSIGTKLLISGGAGNHSTLSKFVKNLLVQDSVLDAKVLETSSKSNQGIGHINFVIEVVWNQEAKYS